MDSNHTISSYLIDCLYKNGIDHIFGVPGDYVLGFYKELDKSPIEVINTGDEQGAGFAADAYARGKGLSAVCITYCVGGLKVANTTAQAYAEKSPVIVISGSPGTNERTKQPLLHHKVKDFDTQLRVFESITVASTVLNDPETACSEIDRVLDAAIRNKRPVYIELPRDMVSVPVKIPEKKKNLPKETDKNSLNEALVEVVEIINQAERPVIIAGVEIHRFGMQEQLLQLLRKSNIPFATTLLSKSVVVENHPLFLGVYEGAMGRKEVIDYVESSDCLLLLGVFMSDINLGIFTAHIDQEKTISLTSEKLSIHYHSYQNINMDEFLSGLCNSEIRQRDKVDIPHPPEPETPVPEKGKQISVNYLFQRLNTFIDDNTVVIADPGDAMFGAIDMNIRSATEFLSPAYYASLGFAVPASIGIQLAMPERRPLVLVGDGAFQMSGMELGSAVRFNLNPIVIVLNNCGYGTERPMLDGSFNDVALWDFSKLPEVFGKGKGFAVHTEDEFETAIEEAKKYTESFSILDVHIEKNDISEALKRLTEALGKKV